MTKPKPLPFATRTARLSRGAQLLEEALSQRDQPIAALERELGVSPGVVRRWCRGEKMPTAQNITILLDILRVPADAWGREPKKSRTGSAA
jgi:transcriptional regulator with XRE-family HTH domain